MKVGLNEAKSQTTRSLSFDLSEDYLRLTKPEASWPEMALRQSSVRRSPLSLVGAAARTYPASNPCLSVARLFFSWFALGSTSRCLEDSALRLLVCSLRLLPPIASIILIRHRHLPRPLPHVF